MPSTLRLKLEFVELLVNAAAFDQLGVFAGIHDASLTEHNNEISLLDRGKPVRNANGRAAPHQIFERRLNGVLGLGVQRAGCFVQNQNRRV